jgi:glycine cleavage system H protein
VATVNNCNLPDDLLYWPEKHVWVRVEDDGTITVGMTDVAQSLAGPVIAGTAKAVGKKTKKGRSSGTVESSKWVGPVTAPVTGIVEAVNTALVDNPTLINSDPYGEGWFIKIKPNDWDGEKGDLVTGEEGIAAYQAFLDAEGISCKS